MSRVVPPVEPEPLLVDVQGQVAVLTLNRPDARNALSRALVAAGQAALDELAGRADVTCIVLTGAGDKAFCAGADLKERRGMTAAETEAFLQSLNDFCAGLAAFPRPVIAALNGAAFGGGLELALCCDIRVASTDAVMGLTEVKLGIIPGAGGTQRLTRLCGPAVAKALILTGRRIEAGEALRLGLVSEVTAPTELRATALRWAAEIAEAGPLAVAQAKRAIDEGQNLPLGEALAVERACYRVVLASEDRDEGLRAFAEKRKPRYKGR